MNFYKYKESETAPVLEAPSLVHVMDYSALPVFLSSLFRRALVLFTIRVKAGSGVRALVHVGDCCCHEAAEERMRAVRAGLEFRMRLRRDEIGRASCRERVCLYV